MYKVKLVSNQIQVFSEIKKFNPDIIFNDILNTDLKYMRTLRKRKIFLVNFEDLGEGRKHSDLIFNPIFSTTKRLSNEYYGSEFACVRDEFRMFERTKIRKKIKKISITLGGVDDDNNTFKIIEIIYKNKILKYIRINIILGFGFKHKQKLMYLINLMNKQNYKIIIIEKNRFYFKIYFRLRFYNCSKWKNNF